MKEQRQEQSQAGYWSVIPAYILFNNEISNDAKILYAHISVLVKAEGYCWATNSYFAKVMKKSVSSIHRYLRELIRNKIIIIDDTQELRKIFINNNFENNPVSSMTPPVSNMTHPHIKNDTPPRVKNDTHNIYKELIYKNKYNNIAVSNETALNSDFSLNSKNKEKNNNKSLTSIVHKQLLDWFYKLVINNINSHYVVTPAEAKHLQLILKKILTIMKRDNQELTPDNLIYNFQYLITKAAENKFLKENFELKKINSQFNSITQNINKNYFDEKQFDEIFQNGVGLH